MMALTAGPLAIATGLLVAAGSSITVTPAIAVTDPIDVLVADGGCGSLQRDRLANAAAQLRAVVERLRGLAIGTPSYKHRRTELARVEVALARCGRP